ncbi:MAG: PilC/PilY family type IV pilus protein [Thiotrichaceae bacterium]
MRITIHIPLKTLLQTFVFISAIASAVTVSADDTEVFASKNISNNLLFVMDVSGSMRKKITVTTTNGVPTTDGGTANEFDQTVTNSTDDASQLMVQEGEATAGDQVVNETELNFRPDNIVATRYRFDRGDIPQGATITRAYLKFFASSNNSENTAIDISIEDAANQYFSDTYDYRNSNRNPDFRNDYYHGAFPTIVDRPEYGSILWEPSNWSTNGDYESVDVTSLVQQVVNKDDWDNGNYRDTSNRRYDSSLAFKFITRSGERNAYSRDNSEADAPELHIEFEYDDSYRGWERYRDRRGRLRWRRVWVPRTTTGNPIFTWTKNSYDDAEQPWTAPLQGVVTDEAQLSFTNDKMIALRFDLSGNTIPEDSVITSTFIQFTAASSASDEADINIQIENTGSSLTFGGSNPTIKQRSYHGGTQRNWNPGAWVAGESLYAQRTPDLTQQVQHVIDNFDGQALSFMLFGSTGGRIVNAMDAGSGAPVLHLEYQTMSGTTTGDGDTVTRTATRLELMQEALREVLHDAPNVSVGLMKYSGMSEYNFGDDENRRTNFVGGIVYPVSPIFETADSHIGAYKSRDNLPDPSTKNVREFIADVADEWEAKGGTPIVDALYEAALYFRGEQMHYGKNKNTTESTNSPGSHPASYFGGAEMPSRVDSVGRSAITDAHYKSPIKSECQSNYMVLMSDGAPTYYYGSAASWGRSQGPFSSSIKGTATNDLTSTITSCNPGNGENADASVTRLASGTCGREITQYLANNDQMPDDGRGGNDGVTGEQTVKTFTIGFGRDLSDGAEEYLRSLETIDGAGGYYTADNKTQLKNAFQNIFETVSQASGSLASPGYSVNVKNGLEHEKDIYIPVFDRKNGPMWSGNLKKFALVDDGDRRLIQGSNNKNAVDELGGFTNDALDFWSNSPEATPDGTEVLKGGVAELINPENRLVLTDAGCSGSGECDLTASGTDYKLLDTNTAVTTALLNIDNQGLSDAAKVTKRRRMINFIRGWDEGFYDENATPKGISRHHMGDMLHSEPVVITYDKGTASDGSDKKQFIFAGTNEGYLHAFDTVTGEEVFAFMPSELLKNIDTQFTDNGTAADHKYGIDGSMTYWHEDANKNKEVDTGEKVYLYFGLRRGGRSYYALDISGLNATNPVVKRLWKKSSSDTGMSLLGQSWSPPYLAKIGFDGSNDPTKEVVIISGGYDKREDRDKTSEPLVLNNSQTPITATKGHNVYILDAHNGSLLWSLRESMGDTQLTHSIPGGMRLLDVNRNGLIDRMYFGDTGGDLWRLDLSESLETTGDDASVLTKLATLGSSDSNVNARKFYTEPDVAVMRPNGKTVFTVSIGSGFRAHPNDKRIHDKLFVIKETSPFTPLATGTNGYQAVTVSDLATVTVTDSAVTQQYFDTRSKGWLLNLPETGEKVLATPVTFDGVIAFTTLVPAILTSNVDPCAAPITQGRFYAINILTGEPVLDLNPEKANESDPTITDADLFKLVIKGEIAGKPQVIFNAMVEVEEKDADDKVIKTTCEHGIDVRVGKAVGQVTGYDACRLESIYWSAP